MNDGGSWQSGARMMQMVNCKQTMDVISMLKCENEDWKSVRVCLLDQLDVNSSWLAISTFFLIPYYRGTRGSLWGRFNGRFAFRFYDIFISQAEQYNYRTNDRRFPLRCDLATTLVLSRTRPVRANMSDNAIRSLPIAKHQMLYLPNIVHSVKGTTAEVGRWSQGGNDRRIEHSLNTLHRISSKPV